MVLSQNQSIDELAFGCGLVLLKIVDVSKNKLAFVWSSLGILNFGLLLSVCIGSHTIYGNPTDTAT